MLFRSLTSSYGSSPGAIPIAIGIASASLAALVVASGTASVGVIYQDNFSGSSSAPLQGAALTVHNGTSTTWTADTVWKANGSVDESPSASASYGNTYLSFKPTNGHIYTLSADVNATANAPGTTNSWIGLGFVTSEALGKPFYENAGPFILDYVPNSGSHIVTYTGLGLSGPHGYPYPRTGEQRLRMVLDTRGARWTVRFADNGKALGSVYSYTTNPAIIAVGFGTFSATGQVRSFSLTSSSVPDPATRGVGSTSK